MKRSEINAAIREAEDFFAAQNFHLPPFARWSPEDWRGEAAATPATRGLGWDVTDFGLGRFSERGILLFTLRNGTPDALSAGHGMLYCEKAIMAVPGQHCPMHSHIVKTEDIINRGGGRLVLTLRNAGPDGRMADTPVTVACDGVERTVEAGGTLVLEPGESITLEPGCVHGFTAEGGKVLVGEVSLVNDDRNDNIFYEELGRFGRIEEDEAPHRLLVQEYQPGEPATAAAARG
ncbi:MAG: D-lyxose/D-mannose family sugar isomerase [Azospirillaceae bacterium]